MKVAVLDDAGLGLGGGRGVYGKEVYSGILSVIYKDLLGFDVVRVLLGEGVTEFEDVVRVVGSETPILRALHDGKTVKQLSEILREKDVEVIHANIINPRYVNPLITVKKRLGIARASIKPCVVACGGDDGNLYPCREFARQDLRLVDIMNMLRRSGKTVSEGGEDSMG